jgi:hypothetical protein
MITIFDSRVEPRRWWTLDRYLQRDRQVWEAEFAKRGGVRVVYEGADEALATEAASRRAEVGAAIDALRASLTRPRGEGELCEGK